MVRGGRGAGRLCQAGRGGGRSESPLCLARGRAAVGAGGREGARAAASGGRRSGGGCSAGTGRRRSGAQPSRPSPASPAGLRRSPPGGQSCGRRPGRGLPAAEEAPGARRGEARKERVPPARGRASPCRAAPCLPALRAPPRRGGRGGGVAAAPGGGGPGLRGGGRWAEGRPQPSPTQRSGSRPAVERPSGSPRPRPCEAAVGTGPGCAPSLSP